MARPPKATVDYFSHDCNHDKTVTIMINKFGISGYAFLYLLKELLGRTTGHIIDCNGKV